ncbi:MAG: deoxyribonuclease IV [Planctomycetota bacterium]
MILGAHLSTQGGLPTAFDRAEALGCDTFQIFTKNRGAWASRALRDDEVGTFRSRALSSRVRPVFAHAAYLLNPASPDGRLRARSAAALRDEIERCERLGIPYLVLHPGHHMGAGERAGERRIAAALDRVFRETRGFRAKVLLENSAGAGSSSCASFAALGRVLADVRDPERLGVCVDTCHAFAAGYDLRSPEAYEAAVDELRREVGLRKVRLFHVNDSRGALGSRVDRHASVGRGRLGKEAFRNLLGDRRFRRVPMLFELPPVGKTMERNLCVLRAIAKNRGQSWV